MKKKFQFKDSFYSFIGGTIASFASTIIYGAITVIATAQTSAYFFEWASGIILYISCACFLCLASNLSEIDSKYTILSDLNGDRTELWFRAIRVVIEDRIKSHNMNYNPEEFESEVTKRASRLYRKLVTLLLAGCATILLGLAMLVVANIF